MTPQYNPLTELFNRAAAADEYIGRNGLAANYHPGSVPGSEALLHMGADIEQRLNQAVLGGKTPVAYGMPNGDVFPWGPGCLSLAGVVRLYSKGEIEQFRQMKQQQDRSIDLGYLADMERKASARALADIERMAAERDAAQSMAEMMSNVKIEARRLASQRAQLLQTFHAP